MVETQTKKAFDDFAQVLETARALLFDAPSRAGWLQVCRLVEEAARLDRAACIDVLIPQIKSGQEAWPARLRMAPATWIERLLHNELPLQVLGLVSAVTFSPVSSFQTEEALCNWLAELPPDTPALQGIHFGLRYGAKKIIAQAFEAAGREMQEINEYDQDTLTALLCSPLARAVEVLDLSHNAPNEDIGGGDQETLYGRFAHVGDIAKALQAPEKLRILDLHGHNREPGAFARNASKVKQKLSGLESLNVGGGHPYNTSDLNKLAALLKGAPLRALHLAPNSTVWVLGMTDEDYDAYETLDYWNLEGGHDYICRKLKTTASSLQKCLTNLPQLQNLWLAQHYQEDTTYQKVLAANEQVEASWRSAYSTEGSFASNWENHFDW